jgi:nucleotide-binding universal stress UspA family protein
MASSNQVVRPARFVLVVGIDFSAVAASALEQAVQIAERVGDAEIHLVHVVIPHISPPDFSVSVWHELSQLNAVDHAGIELQRVVHSVQSNGTRAEGHVRVGRPDCEIARLAAVLDADLIVVGTHGRRGLDRLILGSIAERVVRRAPCAVLIHRPRDRAENLRMRPLCRACMAIQKQTHGATLFCAWHSEHHTREASYDETPGAGSPRMQ